MEKRTESLSDNPVQAGKALRLLFHNVPEFYYYTKYGQLRAKTLGAEEDKNPLTSLKYFYSRPGMIVAREVNGARQNYKYDKKGQLLGVCDGKGNVVEEYVYDPAGNILKKTIQGRTTTYKYDKANQLVSSECNGKVMKYEYDAAGRLVKEGDKVYSYIGLDKIESVTEGGQKLSSFTYHIDGQLAEAVTPEKRESFQWDGLALIQRNSTNYVNEPAVTGGNPILADDKVLFNDMLGTTLGVKDDDKVMQNNLTAFGESLSTSLMQDSFFTGKPHVGELGYAFLFRNYRADQGKWQTSDPLGYPDGWNNFAYVNNRVTNCIDWLGAYILENGYESTKRPGTYSWKGNFYSIGGFLYHFSGGYETEDGGPYAFSVTDSPSAWDEGFGYTVNEDGSVHIPSIYSWVVFSGILINNGLQEEHQFSFTITISVNYYVTTETHYNEDNSITVDYYGNVMYLLNADGVELCNSTVFPHQPILLNTVKE